MRDQTSMTSIQKGGEEVLQFFACLLIFWMKFDGLSNLFGLIDYFLTLNVSSSKAEPGFPFSFPWGTKHLWHPYRKKVRRSYNFLLVYRLFCSFATDLLFIFTNVGRCRCQKIAIFCGSHNCVIPDVKKLIF